MNRTLTSLTHLKCIYLRAICLQEKKYVDKICYKVQNIVRPDNDSMNIEQTDESISLGGIQEKHSSLEGVWSLIG